jgi:hypothetical protein
MLTHDTIAPHARALIAFAALGAAAAAAQPRTATEPDAGAENETVVVTASRRAQSRQIAAKATAAR